jgi:GAF domain-containing protein
MTFELKSDDTLSKEERYKSIIPQIRSLVSYEKNFIANLANVTSVLKYSFDNIIWVGFYLTEENNELVLGPFQGRLACTRIHFGKGVCGTSALTKETIVVDDVDKFPGHIVCDSLSKSEVVVPVIKDGQTVAVLDIDSDVYNNFNLIDKKYLEELIENILHLF